MEAKISTFAICLIFTLAPLMFGCSTIPKLGQRPAETKGIDQGHAKSALDLELISQIEQFAEDVGEKGQSAWKKLQSYHRDDLIASLLRLHNSLPKVDPLHVKIAFVLCNLDYEYQANVEII